MQIVTVNLQYDAELVLKIKLNIVISRFYLQLIECNELYLTVAVLK